MAEDSNTSHNDVQARRDTRVALGCALAVALLVATVLLVYIWWA